MSSPTGVMTGKPIFRLLLLASIAWVSGGQAAVVIHGVDDPEEQLDQSIRAGAVLEGWRTGEHSKLRPLNNCLDWWHVRDEYLPRGSLQLKLRSGSGSQMIDVGEGQWRLYVGPESEVVNEELAELIEGQDFLGHAEYLKQNFENSACASLTASQTLGFAGKFAEALEVLERVDHHDFGGGAWGESQLLRHKSMLQYGARHYREAFEAAGRAYELDKISGFEISAALSIDLILRSNIADAKTPDDFSLMSEAANAMARLAAGSVAQGRLFMTEVSVALAREAFAEGVDTALKAQAIFEERTPSSDWLHVSLNARGVLLWYQGKLREAADVYRDLLKLPGVSKFRLSQAQNNLGLALVDLGYYAEAETVLQKQLRDLETTGQKLRAVFVLINLGISMNEQGDFELAAAYYDKALRYQEELEPGTMQTARILNNYGGNQRHLEKFEESRELLLRGKAIADKLQPGSTLAGSIREGLSDVELDYGNLDAALAIAQEAYQLHSEGDHGDLRGARVKYRIGMIQRLRGDLDVAESLHRQSLFVRRQMQPGTGFVAQSLHELSLVAAARGDFGSARMLACEAVEVLEVQRKRTGSNAARGSRFNEVFGPIFQSCLEHLVRGSHTEEALAILEQSRASSLLSLLTERDLLLDQDLPAELRVRRAEHLKRYQTLQEQLAALGVGESDQRKQLEADIQATEQERASLVGRMRESNPRFADLQYPKPLSADQIKERLEPDAAYVAYAVGETATVLFGVGPRIDEQADRELISKVLPLGREALVARTRTFRQMLSSPNSTLAALQEQAAALYRDLVSPAAGLMGRAQRVIFSPDGPLLELPFEALVVQGDGPRYLIERLPVSYTLSATVYARLADLPLPGSDRVIAFANPDIESEAPDLQQPSSSLRLRLRGLRSLPAAEDEVRSIQKHFGASSSAFIGAGATEHEAKALSSQAQYLHFAVHGLLNKSLPLSSALLLGDGRTDDGLLHAWEIFESVRTNADLVTLSACETGLGKTVSGEGMIGLVRAFQYAGARNIVASLWRVSDRSTATLMNQFYGELAAGTRKDEALRAAKLQLLHGTMDAGSQPLRAIGGMVKGDVSSTAHPFYWAAFQLQR